MKAKEIRKANPQGRMTKKSGTNDIVFDNGVVFENANFRAKTKLWNKLKRMGFEQHYNFSSDEMDGIAQAGKNGENPFRYTMICANPALNERAKPRCQTSSRMES